MPKERLPMVQPIGGGSGITRDGRLVSGVTGRGRAVSLSDGHVAQRPAPPGVLPMTPPAAGRRVLAPYDLLSATPFRLTVACETPFGQMDSGIVGGDAIETLSNLENQTNTIPWRLTLLYAPHTCSTLATYQAVQANPALINTAQNLTVNLPERLSEEFAFPDEVWQPDEPHTLWEQRGMAFFAHGLPQRDPELPPWYPDNVVLDRCGRSYPLPPSARAGDFHVTLNVDNIIVDKSLASTAVTLSAAMTDTTCTLRIASEPLTMTCVIECPEMSVEGFGCVRHGGWSYFYSTDTAAAHHLYLPFQRIASGSAITYALPADAPRSVNVTVMLRLATPSRIATASQAEYDELTRGTVFE